MIKRDSALDIIRIAACIMVVTMHSPLPSESANGPFLVALNYMTDPCIGLFFMVSGALLLPVTKDYTTFLKIRLGKVVVPTIFWTSVYIVLKIHYHPEDINLWKSVLSVPFSAQGYGILWFMYTLVGLYLIAPILSAWLGVARKKDLQIVLALWGATLCYPVLNQWLEINNSNSGILYYFGGYAGYFLLGYYINKYATSKSIFIPSAIAATGAIYLLAAKKIGVEVNFSTMFAYLSIFVCSLTVCAWIFFQQLHRYISISRIQITSKLAKLSFGVYLVHIAIMRYWLWDQKWILNIK